MNTRLIARRPLLLSLPLLTGCSVLPTPRSAQIYRLSPTVPDPPGKPIPRVRLAIDLPQASQSLETDRIALLHGPARFDYYADSVWTDRLPVLLQTLIVEAFEADGRVAEIRRNVYAGDHGYLLRTDLRQFQADYASSGAELPMIAVVLHVQLTAGMNDRFVAGRLVSAHARPMRNRMGAIVAAFDAASAAALAEIVAWTTRAIAVDRSVRARAT